MTGMEMCEVISKYWLETTGQYRSPDDIWNYSPHGELFMVFHWYNQADMYYKVKDELETDDVQKILKEAENRLVKKYASELDQFKQNPIF